jgi:hypothetical protein
MFLTMIANTSNDADNLSTCLHNTYIIAAAQHALGPTAELSSYSNYIEREMGAVVNTVKVCKDPSPNLKLSCDEPLSSSPHSY